MTESAPLVQLGDVSYGFCLLSLTVIFGLCDRRPHRITTANFCDSTEKWGQNWMLKSNILLGSPIGSATHGTCVKADTINSYRIHRSVVWIRQHWHTATCCYEWYWNSRNLFPTQIQYAISSFSIPVIRILTAQSAATCTCIHCSLLAKEVTAKTGVDSFN